MPDSTDTNPPVIWMKFERLPNGGWELLVPLRGRRYPITPEVSSELDELFLNLEYAIPHHHD